jgi:hypothetical protein
MKFQKGFGELKWNNIVINNLIIKFNHIYI